MPFTDIEVIELVKKRPNSNKIEDGLRYESRLRVLTQSMPFEDIQTETGYQEILDIMQKQLHPDKYDATKRFFTYPLPINNLSNSMAMDLFRVFDGRNANFSIQYPTENLKQRSEVILSQVNTRQFIETWGKKVLTYAPNSFVVVDKREDGTPYLLFLFNSDIVGYKWKDKNNNELDFIIFNHSEIVENGKKIKLYGFYDSERYRVIERRQGGVYNVIVNNEHTLGACPARPFLSTRLNEKNDFNRMSPFGPISSSMAMWTLFDVYFRYAELFGVYPVVEMDKPACTEEYCENGIIKQPLDNGGYTNTDCQTCKKSKLIGAGTVVQIDTAMNDGEKDASGVFRFITPDITSLKYERELQMLRTNEIKKSVTGVNDVMENEAVNADQVRSLMEDRKSPLLFIAMQLNSLHKWIVESVIKLAFNTDVKAHANYGTEWFLLTQEQIQRLFSDAKKAGLPESEIDQIYLLLIETKYKGDPEKIRKLLIENNLNPAPYHSLEECYKKKENNVMSTDDLAIKANLTNFTMRFERENGSIVSFGEEGIATGRITFADKIDTIRQTFIGYLEEINNDKEEQVREDDEAEPIEQSGGSSSD